AIRREVDHRVGLKVDEDGAVTVPLAARSGKGAACLAGAGRAHQQDTLGRARAEPLIGGGMAQEVNLLGELLLGAVRTGHVAEGGPELLPAILPRAALAQRLEVPLLGRQAWAGRP